MIADTLIENVLIADGSGTPAQYGAVLVHHGVIADVIYHKERMGASPAAERINGRELMLAPGFIDAHGHSDLSLLAAPEAIGKISQGITTEIAGNCGLSPFPITDNNREHLEKLWQGYGEKLTWHDYRSYRQTLLKRNPAINLYVQCGHNTLRAAVAGYETRQLSSEQLSTMKLMLLEMMQQGAIGFSTGLLYTPGLFSDENELVELLKVTAPFLRVYTTHLRSEGNKLIEAVTESIRLCRNSGQRYLHLSHLKTAGLSNHSKINQLLKLIDDTNLSGCPVITADRYPYIESLTQLSVALPSPFDELDDISLQMLLEDPEKFNEVVSALEQMDEQRLLNIRLVSTNSPQYRKFVGLKIMEISNITIKSGAWIVADILRQDAPGTMAAFSGMNKDNMLRILQQNYVTCGTDESARPKDFSLGVSHPRGFGSIANFIKYLCAEDTCSIEEAIARITSLPARIFNLANRGKIAPDMAADLVLFQPDRLQSNATFSSPHELTSGIDTVWVNGKIRYSNQQIIESTEL